MAGGALHLTNSYCAPGAALAPDRSFAQVLHREHERPAAVAGELAPEASTSDRAGEDELPRDVVRLERSCLSEKSVHAANLYTPTSPPPSPKEAL